MSLADFASIRIAEPMRPAPMSGDSGIPSCKRCKEPLRIIEWGRPLLVEAFKAQDIQIHWLTGERVHAEILPGLFHRECALAELGDLPGVETWEAGSEAYEAWVSR